MPLYDPTQPLLVLRGFRGGRKTPYKPNEAFDPADAGKDPTTIENLMTGGYLRHGTPIAKSTVNAIDEEVRIARFEEKTLTLSGAQAKKKREEAEARRAARAPQIPKD